jgi:hypothetical protein
MNYNPEQVVRIQQCFRGYRTRLHRLPLIMYVIQRFLKSQAIQFSIQHGDGRVNSSMDENTVIELLIREFGERIKVPKEERMWFDILVRDHLVGWIPINIKSTKTTTPDNVGNMAICVYAYTNEALDIHRNKTYNSGEMSGILLAKLQKREYSTNPKKDYYFLVLNKTDSTDVIVNSLKGLTVLTPNIHNLPFQVKWSKNREFKYKHISDTIQQYINCTRKPEPSWNETFMSGMRTLRGPLDS